MGPSKNRFEFRIETVISPAALATFRVPLHPTALPASTVYRFSVDSERDLTEIVQRLTERDVEVLEIRRRLTPRRARRPAPPAPTDGADVVVPFRIGTGVVPPGAETAPPPSAG
jgi:hypothetical protein